MEAFQEALQQLIGIVNPLRILSHNPDHGSPGLRLIQRVEVLTQGGNHALVPNSTIKKKATMKQQNDIVGGGEAGFSESLLNVSSTHFRMKGSAEQRLCQDKGPLTSE